VPNTDTRFLGHPRGLGLLFGVEMWERFSYYGMRALLVLYLVNGLHWSDRDAANLYGTYTGLVYGVQIIGGFLADRFFGTRRSLLIGGAVIALGHFVLAIPTGTMLYLGLGLVIAGTGLFKPNVSTMVGQLYAPEDTRRDAGFTIFYMGINVGATFAPLVTGYLAQKMGWHWGFGAAGVGMVLGLLIYVWGRDTYLAGVGVTPPGKRVAGGTTAVSDDSATTRILALLLLFAFVGVFWMGYDQAGTSVNLFTDRHVDRHVGSFETPTAWYQSVQPFAVLVFAPIFAGLWAALSRRNREPSTPAKMGLGLGLLALSFVVLAIAGRRSDAGSLVGPWWIVAAYVIQVLGEMCVSPVGLSYVTKVAPVRYASLLMAAWFLATGVGDKFAGVVAGIAPTMTAERFFWMVGAIVGVATVLLALIVPWLRRATARAAVSS
jgi:POT family proton-dependent oligopeptide transporter